VSRSFTYDGRGRRKTDTFSGATSTYAWDAESRLLSVARPGVTTNAFGYNGLDARMSKTDSSGTYGFKRNGAGVTDPVLSDGAATYTPGISERRGGNSKFLHSGMKNADAQSGASANVDSSRTYDAFGNLTGSSGAWSGPFGYAGGFGYQEDPDHGLRLLGHRYYDSSTGRFISKDPAGAGRNWIVYAGSNPSRYADPAGLSGIDSVSNNPQTAGWALAEINGVATPTLASAAATESATFAGLSVTARASAVLARLDAATLRYLMGLPPAVLKLVLECFDEFEGLARQAAMGPMSGRQGTLLHSAMATTARGLRQEGVEILVEQSFLGRERTNHGRRGSIRYDVIFKWSGGALNLDWKFGKKLMDEARKRQLEGGLPPAYGPTTVIGVPAKGTRSGIHRRGQP